MSVSLRETAAREQRAAAVHAGRRGGRGAVASRAGHGDHWSRGKLAVAAVVLALVALVAAVLGALGMLWRQPALPGLDTAPVLVVWRQIGQEAPTLSVVERGRWRAFVASRLGEQERGRRMFLDGAHAEMDAALAPVFAEMKGRIKDFNNWFYSFPTTYRMAFTGGLAAFGRDKGDSRSVEQVATEALNKLLQDRFLDVVVMPERFGPTVDGIARTVLQRAIVREQEVGRTENQVVAAFMAEHGRVIEGNPPPPTGEPTPPVVLSWEALGIPAAAAMAAPPDAATMIKSDPALAPLQTTATTEGMMLVARQLARRVVNSAVSDAAQTVVVPWVVGSHLGPLEAVVSPVLGITAFGIGIAAEAGTVSLRQIVEGQRLTDLSEQVVDHLRESQSRALSNAVVQRIDAWLKG